MAKKPKKTLRKSKQAAKGKGVPKGFVKQQPGRGYNIAFDPQSDPYTGFPGGCTTEPPHF